MTKHLCHYAIVRFAPFVETGEFANVGIVMLGPQHRFFDFKLLVYRYARVTRFFEYLDAKMFRETMRMMRDELQRAAALLRQQGFDPRATAADPKLARRLFEEIVRPRETILRFSPIRDVLTDDPQAKLQELYGYYVERNFAVSREYQETVLERGLRQMLQQARIAKRFERADVGNADYHVAFPFVERREDAPVKAIKPLHLAQDEPSRILDHGGQWVWRVQMLKQRELLPPQVLFAVNGPRADAPRRRAVDEIIDRLQETGVAVVDYEQKQQIIEFAAA